MPARVPYSQRCFSPSLQRLWDSSLAWCHCLIGRPGRMKLFKKQQTVHQHKLRAPESKPIIAAKKYSIARNRHQQYRLSCQVRQLDGVCRISGTERSDCDAAHIVPLSVLVNYDVNNAILLTKTLHNAFDRHQWCFDVSGETVPLIGYAGWCYVRLALAPDIAANNMIRMYASPGTENMRWFAVRTECLPALRVRQQVCRELWNNKSYEGVGRRVFLAKVVEIYRKYLGKLF